MNKYKINIHAHSLFSDGRNSPLAMAQKCYELGFTALVLTDHYYNGEHPETGLTKGKLQSYSRALNEAKAWLPVIRGIEVPFGGEEILVFGSTAINEIFQHGGIHTIAQLKMLRDKHYCAMVLCHPNFSHVDFIDCIDGYERHNSGRDFFRTRELGGLESLQAWHNSDAHHSMKLERCYNITSSKITTEDDLIKYIKSGAENEPFVCDRQL